MWRPPSIITMCDSLQDCLAKSTVFASQGQRVVGPLLKLESGQGLDAKWLPEQGSLSA